ncbi:MAG TPA: hypothetical protein VH592_04665 [Gemmataceae bacterium]|jgi:hypothetical protein
MRPTIWRVRVLRYAEEWIDVQAVTPSEAEIAALGVPRVAKVFPGSAVRGDETARPEPLAGVTEE